MRESKLCADVGRGKCACILTYPGMRRFLEYQKDNKKLKSLYFFTQVSCLVPRGRLIFQ